MVNKMIENKNPGQKMGKKVAAKQVKNSVQWKGWKNGLKFGGIVDAKIGWKKLLKKWSKNGCKNG